MSGLRLAILSGTCRTGSEGDRGKVIHQVPGDHGWGTALCGAKPGRTSAYGWLPVDEIKPTHRRCDRCDRRSRAPRGPATTGGEP